MSTPTDHGRFPGWSVVAAAFVVLMVSAGLGFYGLAVYLNAFSRERGWDVASVSLATTVFFLVGGVMGLGIAKVLARRDVRHVVVFGGVAGAVALAVLGQAQEPWHLFVLYGLFAIGWSCAGLVPATTVVTRWFHAKRSVALSVASTGLSVGGIVITPFAKWLLDERGVEAGTPWLGVIWFVGIVPVALFMLHSDPAAKGWLPDGERAVADAPAPILAGVAYHDAVRTRLYRAITVGYVLVLGSQVGGIQQLVKLVEERTDRSTATLATTVLAATSVVSRLVGGRLATKVDMLRLTVGLALVQGVSMAVLGLMNVRLGLFATIIVFGATVGNLLMLQPLLVADRFGVKDYPRIFGRSQFITVFGTAGGPLLLGWLHDAAGGYRTSYLVAGVCSLAGGMVLARGRREPGVERPVAITVSSS
jgi:MFS family permease